MVEKRKHPRFKRTNVGRTKRSRLKDVWRRPRGTGNKQRQKLKKAGKLPSIGYSNPRSVRDTHPLGKPEVIVHNLSELEEHKGKDVVVRIAGTVGKRKKTELLARAKEYGLHVVNPNLK